MEDLWVPILVSFVTAAVISPLVGWYIKPYIETRKNKIVAKAENEVNLIALIKVVRSNLNLVHREASKESINTLIPTTVLVLQTRLNKIERDVRDIIYRVTLLESYGGRIKTNHDYGMELARIAGGALRIKDNVEKNTPTTINGKNGLRKVNKEALESYLQTLDNLLKDVARSDDTNFGRLKNASWLRMFL